MPFSEARPSDWSGSHIARHGVSMEEVAEVLRRRHRESPGRDGSTIITGRTAVGRYLLIVAVDDDGLAFIVTARPMTDREKRTFKRSMR